MTLLAVGGATCVAMYARVTRSYPAVGVAVAITTGRTGSGSIGNGKIEKMLQPSSNPSPTLIPMILTMLYIFPIPFDANKKGEDLEPKFQVLPFHFPARIPDQDAAGLKASCGSEPQPQTFSRRLFTVIWLLYMADMQNQGGIGKLVFGNVHISLAAQ